MNPHPDWSDRIEARIGWTDDPDMTEQPLEGEHVDEITEDEVILDQDLHVDRTGVR